MPRPFRVPRALADPLLQRIGGWLEGVTEPTAGPDAGTVPDLDDPRVAPALRRLIAVHGVAPALVRDPIASAVPATLPDDLRAWLLAQDDRNRARIERLLEELGAALRALAAADVAVMPLKGAILATRSGADPFRRPMADLDLLVRPGDLEVARATLIGVGYRRRPDRTRRPTHDTFEKPGNEAVISVDGEDPDNPRRIELHTEVRRHLWGWVDDDDLTEHLWAEAVNATVLGEPAILPSNRAFAAHLAIHATSDLLVGRGRLIQWLDLAEVTGQEVTGQELAGQELAGDDLTGDDLAGAPHPRLVLPAVRLAVRRLPGRFPPGGPAGLDRLEAVVPDRLARWARRVPLDTRAGLGAGGSAPGDASALGERWVRWAPYPWRLAVAHGEEPLAVAAVRHARHVVEMARRRPT